MAAESAADSPDGREAKVMVYLAHRVHHCCASVWVQEALPKHRGCCVLKVLVTEQQQTEGGWHT